MFASNARTLWVLQSLGIILCVLAAVLGGLYFGQPSAVLALVALEWMPQPPLINDGAQQPQGESEEEEDAGYDGKPGFGFTQSDTNT